MKVNWTFPFVSILCFFLYSETPAFADVFFSPYVNQRTHYGVLRLTPEVRYYRSTSNYDLNGLSTAPASLAAYQRLSTDVTVGYGLTSRFSLFGRVTWTRVSLDQTNALSTSSFGFADQMVGANYQLFKLDSGFSVDFQTEVELPTYQNSVTLSQGLPFLGNGSVDFTSSLFLSQILTKSVDRAWIMMAGGGYTYRNQNYSGDLPWTFSIRHQPYQRGAWLNAAASGIFSLQNDSLTALALTRSNGTGGSFASTAVNPTVINVGGEIGYQFSAKERLYVSGGTSLYGKNAPQGFQMALGLQLSFGGKNKEAPTARTNVRDYNGANEGFVNYSTEAQIIKVNDRLNLIKVNKGSDDGLERGQIFDLFSKDEPVARARVTDTRAKESALEVLEYYKEVWIEEGFTARRAIVP